MHITAPCPPYVSTVPRLRGEAPARPGGRAAAPVDGGLAEAPGVQGASEAGAWI